MNRINEWICETKQKLCFHIDLDFAVGTHLCLWRYLFCVLLFTYHVNILSAPKLSGKFIKHIDYVQFLPTPHLTCSMCIPGETKTCECNFLNEMIFYLSNNANKVWCFLWLCFANRILSIITQGIRAGPVPIINTYYLCVCNIQKRSHGKMSRCRNFFAETFNGNLAPSVCLICLLDLLLFR